MRGRALQATQVRKAQAGGQGCRLEGWDKCGGGGAALPSPVAVAKHQDGGLVDLDGHLTATAGPRAGVVHVCLLACSSGWLIG